ncbi:hypothetical protein MXMO3_02466 [Maritalea myrionectae]|uniref:Uncharacterized protein n=1 Tax=Maritalea myrionectae TaxID=454601 RepID=A0A2R4MG14_9HYPH|nr:hypothetical protein [Maritalea myrionectae]AVX04978.1 hypothetical protein MXMO3_02466 [Maritalea myrionectae]
MSRKTALFIGGFALFALGVWLGMHVERWMVVDACYDAGGRINVARGFYNCELE